MQHRQQSGGLGWPPTAVCELWRCTELSSANYIVERSQPSRRVRRKGAALLSGAEEQTARTF